LAVLIETHRLSNEYGSRPLYNGPAVPKNCDLCPEQADAVIPYLIACESRDTENTFMGAAKRFLANKTLKSLNA
jgi:hypothetical protein